MRRSIVALALLSTLHPASRARAAASYLDHVVVVVMENHSYDEVRGLPYIASLIHGGAACVQSYAVGHPSEPNYLALWCGSTMGVVDDACPPPGSPYAVPNLGAACEAAGLTWRAYSENLPSAGSTICYADTSEYTRKHDPWTDFANLNHANERPFSDLAADLAARALPNLAFIVPNNCHNSHDWSKPGCGIAEADAWLAAHLPPVLAALGPNGALILTWDEDDNSGINHILTVFAGPAVRAHTTELAHVTHTTIVRTICDALGLAVIPAVQAERPITDVWNLATPARAEPWGRLKLRYR